MLSLLVLVVLTGFAPQMQLSTGYMEINPKSLTSFAP